MFEYQTAGMYSVPMVYFHHHHHHGGGGGGLTRKRRSPLAGEPSSVAVSVGEACGVSLPADVIGEGRGRFSGVRLGAGGACGSAGGGAAQGSVGALG